MYQVKDKGKGANLAKSKRYEKPPLSANESARLAALCGYQILDTPPEESFDAITRAAALICGTPTALITFVDTERMWFKSRVGLAAKQGPRKGGFCNHSIQQVDVLIVPDARTDERFATHPMVIADPYIRFYAGIPLITSDGYALGTLCVIDYVPRQLSLEQIAALRGLGQEVMTQIELRRKNLELEPVRGRLEMILDAAGEGIYGLDTEGLTTFVNSAAASMLGWEVNDLLGKSMHDVLHHSYIDGTPYPREHCPINTACKQGHKHQMDNEVFWCKDGSFFFVKYTSTPIIQAGKCLGTVVVFEDITEHKRLEEQARREQQFLSVLLDNLEEGIVACDAEGVLTLFNQASRNFHGLSEQRLLPEQWAEHYDLYLPDGKTRMSTADIPLYRALQGEVVRNVEIMVIPKHGIARTLLANAQPLIGADGEKLGAVVAMRDITEQKHAQTILMQQTQELTRSKEAFEQQSRILKSILDSMGDGVIVADEEGKLLFINPAAEQIIGLSPEGIDADRQIEQFCTYLPAMLTPGPQNEPPLVRAMRGEAFSAIEVLMNHSRARRAAWLSVTGSPLKGDDGISQGGVVVFHDSTEQKNSEQRLHYMANYDALTGLPNRTLFFDRLSQALARAPWKDGLVAVLFLDLDRFKAVNDSLGHNIGDLLLKTVAERLVHCLREGDTVARLGGDEFVLILLDVAQEADLLRVIKKIQDSLPQPYHLEGHEVFITTSIGVSLYPNDGETPETLLKNADTAMYLAKEQGRNRFQHYSSTMGSRASQRLNLENALHHALEREEFLLHFQPFMDMKSGKIVGMEALLRWNHPESGMIPPAQFIPLAEETGLIGPIGDWVLRSACLQNKAWQNAGFAPVRIAVNLSSRQFQQQDMLAVINKVLTETGLAPEYLELELTESIMQNAEAIGTLRAIKRLGAYISIDDFGTGYSSLNYLKHFPFDKLKIDRSFIQDIPTDSDNSAITTAIVALGHSLKLKVVAEGVETLEQLKYLRALKCDELQGYLFSKPVSADMMTELLSNKYKFSMPG